MKSSTRLPIKFLKLDTIWLGIPVVAVLVVTNLLQVLPNDFWWHLRTGQIILTEGQIPTTDLFSFTSYGEPWINQAWLMQIFYHAVYSAGGLALIIFSHALLVTLGYSTMLATLTRFYDIREAVLATVVGIILGLMNWSIRPQGLSIAAFGILMALIVAHRNGHPRWIWATIPLFLIWVNGHGGFIFGLTTLGLYVLGQLWVFWRAGQPATQRKVTIELALVGLLSLAVISLNPQGPVGIIKYVISFVQSDVVIAGIAEFGPMTIKAPDGIMLLLTAILTGTMLIRSKFRPALDQWLMLIVFALLALFARRNLIWFGFAVTPLLAAGLADWKIVPISKYPGITALNGILLGTLSLLVLVTLPWFRSVLPFPEERQMLAAPITPLASTNFLCENVPPESRIFQDQVFGGYQVWGCPHLPVFVDTRVIKLYPLELWQDYFAISEARYDWEQITQNYAITHLFLSQESQEWAIKAATASPEWEAIYQDEQAVIFQHLGP